MITVPETVRGNRESIGPDSAAVGRGIREGENQDGRTGNAPGWSSGNSWISKDNQLALNFSQSDVVEDCGNSVKLSDQGIPYQVVDKENRTRRELEEEVGVVTSEQIVGEPEALYLRIREEQTFAYQRLLQDVCGNMQSTSLGLRVMAVSQPT